MQVTPLIFNNIRNKNYTKKSETTAVENRNNSSKKFFVDNRESYGRYIAFGSTTSAVSKKVATLRVLASEVAPFLAKHKPTTDANDSILEQAEAMLGIFQKRDKAFYAKADLGVDFKELDIVAKHLSKPLSYERNIKEYEYLVKKSQKYFVPDDVREYATSISDKMHESTPYLDTFKPILLQCHKTEQDIRNGLANLRPKTFLPELVTRYGKLQEASNMALDNTTFYNDIYFFAQKVSKFLIGTKPDSIGYVSRLDKYSQEEMPLVRSWMQKYETRLPRTSDNTKKAQRLLDENTFSQQEVDDAFTRLMNRRSQVRTKHVNRFRRYFDEHYEFRWEKAHDAQTNAILAKQDKLNGELSQKIDHSEYRFFHNNDRVVYYGEPSVPHNIYGNDGDIPF